MFTGLAWLIAVGVVLQGLWAGEMFNRAAGHGWLTVHQITAYVLVILSLLAAIVAATNLRRSRPGLVWPSVGLFVLMLIQTGLGQAMTDGDAQSVIAAHIPVAVLLMGVAVYVALASSRPARLTR
jgi:heme A synthase